MLSLQQRGLTTMNTLKNHWNVRTELLLGEEKLEKLRNSHVLIAGLGGVGAAAAEMIGRAGVGKMTIIDADSVEQSNRNRQLGALISTDGMLKAEVWEKRLKDINPDVQLNVVAKYLKDEEIPAIVTAEKYDYIIDAIDTIAPKLFLIYHAIQNKVPIVSSMGAGGKIDPTQVRIADISDTHNCKLAKCVRKRLKHFGIQKGLTVVFSPEDIDKEKLIITDGSRNKKSLIGTISYLPPIFGAFCASVVIRRLAGEEVAYSL
jgi:tRNA A37 threonylcarbamoyladenosine dehydratase